MGDRRLKVRDDGREDGRQGHDVRALSHAQGKEFGPAAANEFDLSVGREQLEGADRSCPVYREEQEPRGTLADEMSIEEDGHR